MTPEELIRRCQEYINDAKDTFERVSRENSCRSMMIEAKLFLLHSKIKKL
jgi:hypothetical protein